MIIYMVFNCEEHVGTFFQEAFSTRELAQAYIDSIEPADYVFERNLLIQEYTIDMETK